MSIWKNRKKHGDKQFKGYYVRDLKGERNFVLDYKNGMRRVTFESWQMAKSLGWKKCHAK